MCVSKNVHDRRVFLKDKVIIDQGDVATAAYLIQSGSVKIFQTAKGLEKEIATLSEGQIFGEMALIDQRKHNCSVRALEDTVAYVITPEILETKVKKSDPLVKLILEALVFRLGLADDMISNN